MPRFFSKGFKPQSTNKAAKELIRSEISNFYGDDVVGPKGEKGLAMMKLNADAYNGGKGKEASVSDWEKGASLVDAGGFRVYHDDQREFLSKIYGPSAKGWSGDKAHRTYRSLIGREYAQMLREAKKKSE